MLALYLNDHVSAAAGGLALARRLARRHPELRDFVREVEADRAALLETMADLGVARTRYKEPMAVVAERASRLKPNGAVLRRSPLSDLIEFEAMVTGVHAKRAGWQTLRELTTSYPALNEARLNELLARADRQIELLERRRREVARATLR